MRTIEQIKADIDFVKKDIEECKAHGYSTLTAQFDLQDLMLELKQKEYEEKLMSKYPGFNKTESSSGYRSWIMGRFERGE